MNWSLIGIALGHSRVQQANAERLQKELIAAIKDASRDRERVVLNLVPVILPPEEEAAFQQRHRDRIAESVARDERRRAEMAAPKPPEPYPLACALFILALVIAVIIFNIH